MSDQKMGTHYVREVCEIFRNVAAKSPFPDVQERLNKIADELEPIATKLYFKTQKGTEDMKELAEQAQDLDAKLSACKESGEADAVCNPFFVELEKIIKHVKTMKVRMT